MKREYLLIFLRTTAEEFSQEVTKALNNGFELWGNPFGFEQGLCQAMVRFEAPAEPPITTTKGAISLAGFTVGTPG